MTVGSALERHAVAGRRRSRPLLAMAGATAAGVIVVVLGATTLPAGAGVSITPANLTLDFGNQPVGVASAPLSIVVTNTGPNDFTLGPGDLQPADSFQIENFNCFGLYVPNNPPCAIRVHFKPTRNGNFFGTLQLLFSGTDPGVTGIRVMSLDGVGVPAPPPNVPEVGAVVLLPLLGVGLVTFWLWRARRERVDMA